MKMKIFVFLALCLCASAAEVQENATELEQNKDKRQTREDFAPAQGAPLVYRTSKRQEQVPPVEEPQEDDAPRSRADAQEYRPGQVFSLDPQELLDLQPERKAPLSSSQQLQQLYSSPQQEHRQHLQQLYYLEPEARRQVAIQPSRAVIARPHYSADGGEASVGAALSVSDAAAPGAYDPDLFALLGQPAARPAGRPEPHRVQQVQASTQSIAPQYHPVSTQSVASQYQQIDRYITKPSKKPTKQRPKTHFQTAPSQPATGPQQYLIETTNVQQQQQLPQYRPAPQPQRVPQALRYVPLTSVQSYAQQALYERPETQGLKVVAPPKLQQARPPPQLTYRLVPQYQQPEASPKQYRIVEAPRPQPIRQEQQRIPAPSIERPITYLKRYPEPEKMRAVKIYDPVPQEGSSQQQQAQIIAEQYYLRPVYRQNEQRGRYDLSSLYDRPLEQSHFIESTKPPHSAIYVSKNVSPKKASRPQPIREQSVLIEQPSVAEQVDIEQRAQSLEEQRSQLPPPRNNRAYTPEEFAALVAAGYSVTPIPVAPLGPPAAQARASAEPAGARPLRRPAYSRRHQYLPLRGDDAP